VGLEQDASVEQDGSEEKCRGLQHVPGGIGRLSPEDSKLSETISRTMGWDSSMEQR
jgi:hypothetical protein